MFCPRLDGRDFRDVASNFNSEQIASDLRISLPDKLLRVRSARIRKSLVIVGLPGSFVRYRTVPQKRTWATLLASQPLPMPQRSPGIPKTTRYIRLLWSVRLARAQTSEASSLGRYVRDFRPRCSKPERSRRTRISALASRQHS